MHFASDRRRNKRILRPEDRQSVYSDPIITRDGGDTSTLSAEEAASAGIRRLVMAENCGGDDDADDDDLSHSSTLVPQFTTILLTGLRDQHVGALAVGKLRNSAAANAPATALSRSSKKDGSAVISTPPRVNWPMNWRTFTTFTFTRSITRSCLVVKRHTARAVVQHSRRVAAAATPMIAALVMAAVEANLLHGVLNGICSWRACIMSVPIQSLIVPTLVATPKTLRQKLLRRVSHMRRLRQIFAYWYTISQYNPNSI